MHSYCLDTLARACRLTPAIAALMLSLSGIATAADDWRDQPYAYRVIDQDVRGVLTELGRNLGIPVVLSRSVEGKVRGNTRADTAGEFLTRVATANGLVWYQDGAVLMVDSASSVTNRRYDVRGVDAGALRHTLDGLAREASPLVSARLNGDGALEASGPAGYLERVQQRIDALKPSRPVTRNAEYGIRVFRGGAQTEVVSDRS
ncbi:type III secretion protein [Pseudomonas sp. Marseille-QA0892]